MNYPPRRESVCQTAAVRDGPGMMTVTIEVASEVGGAISTKRVFLRSEDFATRDELEAAALGFMRSAGQANDVALEGGVAAVSAGR